MSDRSTWIEKKFKINKPGELIDNLNRIYDETSYKEAMEDQRIKELIAANNFALLTSKAIKHKCEDEVSITEKMSCCIGEEIGIVTDWQIGEITAKVDPTYAEHFDSAKHYILGRIADKDKPEDPEIVSEIKLLFFYL